MDDLIERCYSLGWTDGLPVVPPTRERVETMAGGRRLREVVAVLEPSRAEATVEKIAANAVMAGCLPAYFPVVLTAVRAIADAAFRPPRARATPRSHAMLVLVNGPVINALGFNAAANVFGSGARANATVGRAVSLVLQNVAATPSGGADAATLGHPGAYSYCIAENEHASPWPPFHTDRGFARDSSTVTVYPADAPLCLPCVSAETPDPIIRTIADALPLANAS
ncbi:MAG: TlpA family protein disulfide reductase, partial [Dehalococcoidia bacterium]|nr:TlpA family protein disulfide reductase [Dehalococcoidia bacterium]